jgi:hypothetical protein
MTEITVPDIGITKALNALNSGLYMAVGSDASPGAAGDLAIAGEIARVPVSVSTVTAAAGVEWKGYFPSSSVGGTLIRKAAVFDAAVAGNLVCEKLVTLAVPAGQGAIITIDYAMARA